MVNEADDAATKAVAGEVCEPTLRYLRRPPAVCPTRVDSDHHDDENAAEVHDNDDTVVDGVDAGRERSTQLRRLRDELAEVRAEFAAYRRNVYRVLDVVVPEKSLAFAFEALLQQYTTLRDTYLVRDLCQRINGGQWELIFERFYAAVVRYRDARSPAMYARDDALPNDWYREPWYYLYVQYFGTGTGANGGTAAADGASGEIDEESASSPRATFADLTAMLPYLRRLGFRNLYLLPHYESAMADGGYDVREYMPRGALGGQREFLEFMTHATRMGFRVATDAIFNHTSTEHAWFRRALAGDDKYVNYYLQRNGREKIGEFDRDGDIVCQYRDPDGTVTERVCIFPDIDRTHSLSVQVGQEADGGDGGGRRRTVQFYRGFYPFQVDLNLQNPDVLGEVFDVLGRELNEGVLGKRTDAIAHWIKRPGTAADGLPETHVVHALLKTFMRHVCDKSVLIPEAVRASAIIAQYAGVETEIRGMRGVSSEGDLLLAFEMQGALREMMFFARTAPFWRRALALPALPGGADWFNLLAHHDETYMGFFDAPPATRHQAAEYIKACGGVVYKNEMSAGCSHFDAMGGEPARVAVSLFALYMAPGVPLVYNGLEIGVGNNYAHARAQMRAQYAVFRDELRISPSMLAEESAYDPRELQRGPMARRDFYRALHAAGLSHDDDEAEEREERRCLAGDGNDHGGDDDDDGNHEARSPLLSPSSPVEMAGVVRLVARLNALRVERPSLRSNRVQPVDTGSGEILAMVRYVDHAAVVRGDSGGVATYGYRQAKAPDGVGTGFNVSEAPDRPLLCVANLSRRRMTMVTPAWQMGAHFAIDERYDCYVRDLVQVHYRGEANEANGDGAMIAVRSAEALAATAAAAAPVEAASRVLTKRDDGAFSLELQPYALFIFEPCEMNPALSSASNSPRYIIRVDLPGVSGNSSSSSSALVVVAVDAAPRFPRVTQRSARFRRSLPTSAPLQSLTHSQAAKQLLLVDLALRRQLLHVHLAPPRIIVRGALLLGQVVVDGALAESALEEPVERAHAEDEQAPDVLAECAALEVAEQRIALAAAAVLGTHHEARDLGRIHRVRARPPGIARRRVGVRPRAAVAVRRIVGRAPMERIQRGARNHHAVANDHHKVVDIVLEGLARTAHQRAFVLERTHNLDDAGDVGDASAANALVDVAADHEAEAVAGEQLGEQRAVDVPVDEVRARDAALERIHALRNVHVEQRRQRRTIIVVAASAAAVLVRAALPLAPVLRLQILGRHTQRHIVHDGGVAQVDQHLALAHVDQLVRLELRGARARHLLALAIEQLAGRRETDIAQHDNVAFVEAAADLGRVDTAHAAGVPEIDAVHHADRLRAEQIARHDVGRRARCLAVRATVNNGGTVVAAARWRCHAVAGAPLQRALDFEPHVAAGLLHRVHHLARAYAQAVRVLRRDAVAPHVAVDLRPRAGHQHDAHAEVLDEKHIVHELAKAAMLDAAGVVVVVVVV